MVINQFRVPGISCEHCVKAVTEEVRSIPGVNAIHVNLSDKSVRVEHNEDVTAESLIAAINEAGYDDVSVLV